MEGFTEKQKHKIHRHWPTLSRVQFDKIYRFLKKHKVLPPDTLAKLKKKEKEKMGAFLKELLRSPPENYELFREALYDASYTDEADRLDLDSKSQVSEAGLFPFPHCYSMLAAGSIMTDTPFVEDKQQQPDSLV